MESERRVRSEGSWPTGGAGTDTAKLVEEARGGSQTAWDELVERFLPLMTSLMRRYRVTGADADDVNQTVWLRLVENLDRIDEPQALPGWLATVTRHECFRMHQLRGRSVPTDPQTTTAFERPDHHSPDLLRELLAAERHTALVDALIELPAQRRDLLLLLIEDPPLTYAEISSRSGIPIGSIGPTRARALQQLRHTHAFRRLSSPEPDGSHR